MLKINRKIPAILILAILTISAVSMITLPTTNAHTPSWSLKTYMFVSVAPDPIGVGQQVNVNFWLNLPPPTANVQYGDRWNNLTVVVTRPDGTTEKLGPFTSDDTGGTSTRYTPTQTGEYTFQSFFGGQILANDNPYPGRPPNAFVGDYYEPSESEKFTLIVQEEPISYAPLIPLPTEYWTRPIYAQNNDFWYAIGGNWLGLGVSTFANTGEYNHMGSYAPYTTAPNSAHLLWTKPVAFGGTMGGEFGNDQQSNYWSTSQYQPKFAPIIIQDILYYVNYPGSTANPAGWSAVNLHTGETIWTKDYTTNLRCGQIMNYLSPNEYGGRAYLWATGSVPGVTSFGTTYSMYDAMTGNYILSIVNASSVSKITLDEYGGLLGYYINSTGSQRSLTVWNSTRTIMRGESGTGDPNGWQWRPPQDGILDFSNGIEWSAPLATSIDGNPISLGLQGMTNDVVLMTYTSSISSSFQPGWIVEAGYSAKDGHLLWGPLNRTQVINSRVNMASECMSDDNVWIETDQSALTATGFDLNTGNKLWGPTALPNANPYTSLGIRYTTGPNGTIMLWTYGGDAYGVKAKTGEFTFEYHSPSAGYESPYGIWPFWTFQVGTVADGKLFLPVGHMYSPPLFHHALQMAINITDGSVVWNITAFDVTSAPAISDGVMVTLNAYDNQIYAWGKGPTQMTVTAPDFGIPAATPIIIRGTIMDISAGSDQEAVAANYPNGLPCVSEESQRLFMETVYMQQPSQTNTTGVPVTIDVVDSNGNYRTIGTTVSDSLGTFSYTWTPDIPGDFWVYAHFDGSESYYPATATTTFHITEPAATAQPTQEPTQSMADLYILPGIIGIIIAIIVVGLVLLLAIRKRP